MLSIGNDYGMNSIRYASLSPLPKPAVSPRVLRARAFLSRDLRCSGQARGGNGAETARPAPGLRRSYERRQPAARRRARDPARLQHHKIQASRSFRTADAARWRATDASYRPCRRRAPGIPAGASDIQIELFEGPREELEKRLEQKKLDVCLTSLNDAAASKTSVALFTSHMCWP